MRDGLMMCDTKSGEEQCLVSPEYGEGNMACTAKYGEIAGDGYFPLSVEATEGIYFGYKKVQTSPIYHLSSLR